MAIVLVLARYVVPPIAPDAEVFSIPLPILGIFAAMLCTVAIIVWWVLFSRAPWVERLGAIILMVVALVATRSIVHESIRGGMMGVMPFVYSVPMLGIALVAWAVATRRLPDRARRAALVGAILLACAPWTLLRTAGERGDGSEFHWRWTQTPEQRLLAQARDDLKPPPPVVATTAEKPVAAPAGDAPAVRAADPVAPKSNAERPAMSDPGFTRAEWPGFRGPRRDSIIPGVRIKTDWSVSPPVEMWRRPIGPGWSSFAVSGDYLYTQEQRGEDETVACYKVSTGEPVWRHRDPVRFWESNAGAGPRATPTVSNGRVYTMGATGIVNALDAGTGARAWTRNAATDTGKEIPDWGLASSPLVVDDLVIVAVAGRLVAYDAATGNPRWVGQAGGGGYSSPHLATIDGVSQILLQRGARTISVAPADGTLLWEHVWVPAVSIVQPALTPDGGLLITTADAMGGQGMRRLALAHGSGGWTARELWTSRGLKPYFNDFVVHKGHAFGFDGSILACVDIEDGQRKWKGGRYGAGQLVLLPDQDVLLVLSEEGELALVKATPDQFTELARFPAIEGKTWNHPALVGNVLLVRNDQEMAAFRLSRP